MYELIIAEKPTSAKKIAISLGKPKAKKVGKITYYELEKDKKKLVIVPAVGHLYTVTEKKKNGWTYPTFDLKWEESHKVSKDASFTKPYLSLIKKLAKDASEFTIACDWDIEGEVIGQRILEFVGKKKDARRMCYSTTTKDDLVNSYDKIKKIDKKLAEAGVTRHELDFLYGINLSRALTLAIKKGGIFKVLSSGRVQGPALKILTDKEKEIQKFVSEPYWQIFLYHKDFEAIHEKDKFWDKKEAENVYKKVKGKKAVVDSVKKTKSKQKPVTPFDLTTLQTESYRNFGISPKETLSLAQDLYTDSYISYPRTSSQKLPKEIGYKKILKSLEVLGYSKECSFLLEKKDLKPNEGKKSDAAHPAIYPTGEYDKQLSGKKAKLYDLIVRRFLAVFGDDAIRETVNVKIDVNEELFLAKGTRTLEKGWQELYGKYAKFEEKEMPKLEEGKEIKYKDIKKLEKETQPPKRYTPASIIKELEKRDLGTKATRASIIDNLFQRDYLKGLRSIEVTNLGMNTVNTLDNYCKEILDEKLTRHFEKEMEAIQEKEKKGEEVIEEAKKILKKTLEHFKKNETKIGKKLVESYKETRDEESNLSFECPKCKKGTLQLRKGKFGNFVCCSNYPDCKTTYNVPNGLVKKSDKVCEHCGFPMLMVIKRGKRPQFICFNTDCKLHKEKEKLVKKLEKENGDKECPKCGAPMILRKSAFGIFYGCSKFPKCRCTERVKQED